ncbi:MAG TPA: MauE/DoxX family redox-associated membrane protein [Pyrinomonadaceae bacterium]|jgi:hypothetical protein
MNRRPILTILARLSRFGLAALFLLAVAAKLYTLNDFAGKVAELLGDSGIVGSGWTWPLTLLILAGELAAAVLLIVRRTARVGALVAGLLLMGFAGFALYYVYGLHKPEGLECGCFGGIIASQLGVSTALRNLLLLIPVGLVLFGPRDEFQREAQTAQTESAATPAA